MFAYNKKKEKNVKNNRKLKTTVGKRQKNEVFFRSVTAKVHHVVIC